MNIGYDYYCIDDVYLLELLHYVKNQKIPLFHLRHIDDEYYFYIPTYLRYKFSHFEYPYSYIKTIGMIKYVLFLSKQLLNVVGILCFFMSILICSHFIFDVQVKGVVPKLNRQIESTLKQNCVSDYKPLQNYEQLNDLLTLLKSTYNKQVEYLNLYQTGSVIHVEYTKKKQDEIEKESFQNLYASKDGMIQSFDIKSGMIQVKVNDYVKKGDLLVENTIISTQNETKIIPVKGHVYAYTFLSLSASIDNHNQDQGEAFYHLLLMIRSKLPAGAKIDKENVLHMEKTRSKISLKMHYTLIEDIAIKGE